MKSVDVVRLKTLMRIRSEVLKFNPNHDDLGRFSEGSGGGTGGGSMGDDSGVYRKFSSVKGTSGRELNLSRVDTKLLSDLQDVSTNEADFARRIDLLIDREAKKGINITTKTHKNESSSGQRIVPSKMHGDDSLSLKLETDPAARMKAVDDALEFYGDRIKYRPPQKKRNWLEESGLISRA